MLCSWDNKNRLAVVTNTAVVPNLVRQFIYDGDGTCVLQVQISGTQVITTVYAGAIEVQTLAPHETACGARLVREAEAR